MTAFAATLLHDPTELRGMRHLLTSWLELTDATEVVRNAVLLATHEAAANAIAHGQPESPVSISASQDQAGDFTVEVINYGAWKEPEAGHQRPRTGDDERAHVRGRDSDEDERSYGQRLVRPPPEPALTFSAGRGRGDCPVPRSHPSR